LPSDHLGPVSHGFSSCGESLRDLRSSFLLRCGSIPMVPTDMRADGGDVVAGVRLAGVADVDPYSVHIVWFGHKGTDKGMF